MRTVFSSTMRWTLCRNALQVRVPVGKKRSSSSTNSTRHFTRITCPRAPIMIRPPFGTFEGRIHTRRFYSTEQVPDAASERNPKLIRSRELLEEGIRLVQQNKLEAARPVLESALDFIRRFDGDPKGHVACYTYLNLAYVYSHCQELALAEELYKLAYDGMCSLHDPNHRDVGLVELNYAELLMSQKRFEEGISHSKNAVDIVRATHKNDVVLASALSNYAVYLCALGKFEDARGPCSAALNIFIRELGKKNHFTRASFANMYFILRKLDLHDQINDLELVWNKIDVTEVPGLNDDELYRIAEIFAHTIKKAEPRINPGGPVKGPNLYKRQLKEFFGSVLPERGMSPTDPQIMPVLEQEIDAFTRAEEDRAKLKAKLAELRARIIQERNEGGAQKEFLDKEQEDKTYRESWKIFLTEERYTRPVLNEAGVEDSELGEVYMAGESAKRILYDSEMKRYLGLGEEDGGGRGGRGGSGGSGGEGLDFVEGGEGEGEVGEEHWTPELEEQFHKQRAEQEEMRSQTEK